MNRFGHRRIALYCTNRECTFHFEYGILSHNRAKRVGHDSVAMSEIQERRKDKQIPGARHLHDYVNLYFDAHNPMLSKLRSKNNEICVLQINPTVLDIPEVIIADQNAAANWVRFFPVTDGLTALDRERVFARYWLHQEDMIDEWRHKAEKCAEVLVPTAFHRILLPELMSLIVPLC